MSEERTLYRGVGSHILLLEGGEWVTDPTRPGERITGPCIIRYRVRPDGSIDLSVAKG